MLMVICKLDAIDILYPDLVNFISDALWFGFQNSPGIPLNEGPCLISSIS